MVTGFKITEHCFDYSGTRYFRDGADDVRLCSYGRKRNLLGPRSELEVKGSIFPNILEGKVKCGKPVKIDWKRVTKADLGLKGALRVFVLNAKTANTIVYEELEAARLELIKFSIATDPLERMLNNEARRARNSLADEGADGRICSQQWAVVSGHLAEHFRTSASTTSSASAAVGGIEAGLNITAKGGKYGTQTITLSQGETFAYQLVQVQRWNKGKTQVEKMKEDQYGLG